MAKKMHAEEVDIDLPLARQLISAQFPEFAELRVEEVKSSGTDNALFKLGNSMAMRLPRVEWTSWQVEKEQRWLPKLAPQLPLAIPTPLQLGKPSDVYPWRWSIYRWLEGTNPGPENPIDMFQAARDLAGFLRALHAIDPTGGPPPGESNTMRGIPLATRDGEVRQAIATLRGELDGDLATRSWEESANAPAWSHPAQWIHGDMQPGNLLAVDGRITAVIDFGCLTVGDPACDLMVAWNLLTADARVEFRAEMAADDATWLRGRGWALSQALIFIPYYKESNPAGVEQAWRVISEVLADQKNAAEDITD
jgi:aminoglycoside phosphotransferase (APT) family kinase protein